jgi:hypothetical protein
VHVNNVRNLEDRFEADALLTNEAFSLPETLGTLSNFGNCSHVLLSCYDITSGWHVHRLVLVLNPHQP